MNPAATSRASATSTPGKGRVRSLWNVVAQTWTASSVRSSGMPSERYIKRQLGEKVRRKIDSSNGTPIVRQIAASVSKSAPIESTIVPSQSKRIARITTSYGRAKIPSGDASERAFSSNTS